jgi:UDP-2-acetamido-3-amino-2,3-dideoxy-glucuronate N-acetyltransferase
MGPGFKVGSDVFIGPNVTVCNDRWPVTHKYGWEIEKYQSGEWAVIIEDGVGIGANAVILPGVRIGKGSMVAAGAVVSTSIPDHHVWFHKERCVPIENDRPHRMLFAPCCRRLIRLPASLLEEAANGSSPETS